MPLPLALLRAAQDKPLMVELKSGETYSGMLTGCDGFMNLKLRDSVRTSRDGASFWKVAECFVRGSAVKYVRLQEELVDSVKDIKTQRRGGGMDGRSRGKA